MYDGGKEGQRISWQLVHPAIVGACEDAHTVSGCDCDMAGGIDSYLAEYLVMDGEEHVGAVSDPDLFTPDLPSTTPTDTSTATNASTNTSTQPPLSTSPSLSSSSLSS